MADAPIAVKGRRPGRRGRDPNKTYGITTLFSDSVIYGMGQWLQKFLSMLLLPLYTIYLSPEDYGVLGMVLITTSMIDVIVTMGWDSTFSRFYFDELTEDYRAKVIAQTFFIDTVYPAVLLGTLALLMPFLSQVIMGGKGYTLYFEIALLTEWFSNFTDLPFSLLRLDHRPMTFFAFTVTRICVQIPLTIVLVAVAHWGVMGVLIGNLVANVVLAIASLPTFVGRLHFTYDRALFKQMIVFSLANFPASIAFFILNFSDRYLLRAYSTLTQVGLYTASYTLAQPVYYAGFAFRMAWPQWHYAWLHDPPKHKRQVARGYTYFTFMTAGLLTLLGVFLPLMIRLLLRRPSYWTIGEAVMVLAFSTAFYNSYHLFLVGVNVTKKNRFLPFPVAIAAAVNIGLNIIFIPRYGMMAAAWSTLIGFALLAVMMRSLSNHYYRIPHEWRRIGKLVLATAVTLVTAAALAKAIGLHVALPFPQLVVRQAVVATSLVLFPLIIWATRFFRPEEKPALRRIWHRVLHPRMGRRGRAAAGEAPPAPALPGAVAVMPADGESATGAAVGTIDGGPASDNVLATLAEAGDAGSSGTDEEDLERLRFTRDQLAAEEERMEEVWETGARDGGTPPL